jgi:putative radical SAM enzyme (TIGR03279 family)
VSISSGGTVASVETGSLAEAAGVRPGDHIVSINGHALHDVIDYRFYAAEEDLQLKVLRGGVSPFLVHLNRPYGAEPGIEFTEVTFDGIRRCRNRCEFCFIRQMPKGLRKSLYVRDDDYRFSFLYGNFITLTNLTENDWARIGEQHLSPLYVSVHASDPELRARLLGAPGRTDVLAQLRRLGSLGIRAHTQIVVTPGLNDGAALQRTVADLAALHPTVLSIGVVPVGLTRYQSCGLRTVTPQEALHITQRIGELQRSYRRQHGVGLVYAADELYLPSGLAVPFRRSYDGFPQLANGIGLTRKLLEDWQRTKRHVGPAHWRNRRMTLVCGTLIAPTLRVLIAELSAVLHSRLNVIPVTNRFFGPTVTVSGLLVAQDVVAALRGAELGDTVVLPRAMFDAAGQVTLDDWSLARFESEFGVRSVTAETLGDIAQLDR